MHQVEPASRAVRTAAWTVDRRGLFGLLGAAAVLTACGGSPRRDTSTASSPNPTPPGPGPATSPPASGPASSPASAVAHLGGAEVPANKALDAADAKRLARLVNGHWRGSWHDEAQRSGTADVTIALNAARRRATATFAFTGDLLGSPVATQGYDVDLLAFVLRADEWHVTTPQFGAVTIAPGGVGSATATATSIDGHPEIASVQLIGTRIGARVDVSYTIKQTSGSTVKGTMSFSARGDRPAAPALTTPGGAPAPGDVQSGAYAASLVTGTQLSRLAGVPLPDPRSNGGRLEYATGIDISNAQAIKHDLDVDYSVLLGHSAALTSAFWKTTRDSLGDAPPVAGPWLDARWYASNATLYVHATPTRMLTVRFIELSGGASSTSAEHVAAAIARGLTNVLNRGS
ncbi:MAG TPA: hypothetical protein VFE19_06390 [Jatrophihabitantaceae bacterium]|nr:hypothetical protein [Jatrophihabitantaceae bacterium]